jgi:hypothetical protein
MADVFIIDVKFKKNGPPHVLRCHNRPGRGQAGRQVEPAGLREPLGDLPVGVIRHGQYLEEVEAGSAPGRGYLTPIEIVPGQLDQLEWKHHMGKRMT